MIKREKNRFALYLKVKKQQRACRRYFKAMKQEYEILAECAVEMV